MPNARVESVTSFDKGLNDLLPPDQLDKAEARELVNLVPGLEGLPLPVRPGYVRFNDEPWFDSPVTGLFRYRTRTGAKHWVTACSGSVMTTAQPAASDPILWNDPRLTYSVAAREQTFEGDDWARGWEFTLPTLPDFQNVVLFGDESSPQGYQSNRCLRLYGRYHASQYGSDMSWRYVDQKGTKSIRFRPSGSANVKPLIIKFGKAENGWRLLDKSETFIKFQHNGGVYQGKVCYRDAKGAWREGQWFNLTYNAWHFLEWTNDGKTLKAKIDGVERISLNFGTVSHDSLIMRFDEDTFSPASAAFCDFDDLRDEGKHWQDMGAFKSTNVTGATVEFKYKSLLPNQVIEVRGRDTVGGIVKVDGVKVADLDTTLPRPAGGKPFERSSGIIVTPGELLATITLGDAGDHTIVVEAGSKLCIESIAVIPPSGSWTTIANFAEAGKDVDFTVMNDKLIFTNGEGLKVWTGTGPATSIEGAPQASQVITFRNRLWATGDPRFPSRVFFSSVLDETNWSGVEYDDGGNLDIEVDNGEEVVGIAPMFNGVAIFKQRSIWLWTYGDADRPDTEGRIDHLVPGVGLVSHDSIAYYNGALIFLGQNAEGDFGIYRLMGQGVEEYSVKIPKALQRILTTAKKPKAIAHKHYYYVAVDDKTVGAYPGIESAAGHTPSAVNPQVRNLVFALDLRRLCWTTFEGMNVGCWAIDRDAGNLYFGSDLTGLVFQYGVGETDDGEPIRFRYTSRPFDGKTPLAAHRFRNIWMDLYGSSCGILRVGFSLDGGQTQFKTFSLRLPGVSYWNDGGTWDSGLEWFYGELERHLSIPLATNRARHLTVTVEGETTAELALARYGVAYRERKTRYNS